MGTNNNKRETGYYWVKLGKESKWQVSEWVYPYDDESIGRFDVQHKDKYIKEKDIFEIDERKIVREQRTDAEIWAQYAKKINDDCEKLKEKDSIHIQQFGRGKRVKEITPVTQERNFLDSTH